MVRKVNSRASFAEHRRRLGISLREAARQLHVSHPAVRAWESGAATPGPLYRKAIDRWSGGFVRADAWPLSKRELAMAESADAVSAPTGTDSR